MMYKKNKVLAIIPARSGSKGIKDKNIKKICGYPMLAYSIVVALLSDEVDDVIVSTDSVKYANIAKRYGAQVPFLRPQELAQDQSLDIDYLYHALSEIAVCEDVPEYIVLLRPTTPMRRPEDVSGAIRLLKKHPESSAVVSVSEHTECPFKWMVIGDEGFLESPFRNMKPDDVNLPRQNFPIMLEPDGYVDVLRSKIILEKREVYGDRAIKIDSPHGVVDIDTMRDFELTEKRIQYTEVYSYLLKEYK